jgi:hypothetical protein
MQDNLTLFCRLESSIRPKLEEHLSREEVNGVFPRAAHLRDNPTDFGKFIERL